MRRKQKKWYSIIWFEIYSKCYCICLHCKLFDYNDRKVQHYIQFLIITFLKLLAFLKKHTIQRESPIAGNSVHMDKMFLTKYMPSVINHLHYRQSLSFLQFYFQNTFRIVDVSTVKEVGFPKTTHSLNGIFIFEKRSGGFSFKSLDF